MTVGRQRTEHVLVPAGSFGSLTDADLTPAQADAVTNAERQAADHGDHVTSEQFKTGLTELRTDIIAALAAQERRVIGYGIAIAGIAIAILRCLD